MIFNKALQDIRDIVFNLSNENRTIRREEGPGNRRGFKQFHRFLKVHVTSRFCNNEDSGKKRMIIFQFYVAQATYIE